MNNCINVQDIAEHATVLTLGRHNEYVQKLLVNNLKRQQKTYKSIPIHELFNKPKQREIIKRTLKCTIDNTQQKVVNMFRGAISEPYIQKHLSFDREVSSPSNMNSSRDGTQKCQSKKEQRYTTNPDVVIDIHDKPCQNKQNGLSREQYQEPNEIHGDKPNRSADEADTDELDNNQILSSWIINTLLQEKLNCREAREESDKWKNLNGILALVLPIIAGVVTGLMEHYIGTCNCSGNQ